MKIFSFCVTFDYIGETLRRLVRATGFLGSFAATVPKLAAVQLRHEPFMLVSMLFFSQPSASRK